ncbi:hypothetical protein SLEP1_g50232 [Rubroshorea leprosula]|uniref:Amine oxidase domain-containing protein n=1 Tax=Rubroshorea leprosula TaxID=152421 RepID=A0AAV5M0N6_9ROSI|nr:hypothetical protein SLEP1_g50232 [Rubroshorea leprosula]
MIQGFNIGGQRAIGKIRLNLLIDDMESSELFHVLDAKTTYNMLLGWPWIHKNGVVSSTLHQCFKYCKNGQVGIVIIDFNPFSIVESHFANAKFYLEEPTEKNVKQAMFQATKEINPKQETQEVTQKENKATLPTKNDKGKEKKEYEAKAFQSSRVLHYVPMSRRKEGQFAFTLRQGEPRLPRSLGSRGTQELGFLANSQAGFLAGYPGAWVCEEPSSRVRRRLLRSLCEPGFPSWVRRKLPKSLGSSRIHKLGSSQATQEPGFARNPARGFLAGYPGAWVREEPSSRVCEEPRSLGSSRTRKLGSSQATQEPGFARNPRAWVLRKLPRSLCTIMAKKPRIVIVGAGMAGLAAANRLYTSASSKDLFDLCVVEGGTRIGERINTSEFGGDRIEMGAMWIHGASRFAPSLICQKARKEYYSEDEPNSDEEGNDSEIIVSFDMSNEVFQKISMPDDFHSSESYDSGLHILKGSFSLVQCPLLAFQEKLLKVWVRNESEVNGVWTQLTMVRLFPIARKPLLFWKDDDILVEYNNVRDLLSYNVGT